MISQFTSAYIGEVSPHWALKWFQSQNFENSPAYFMSHWKTQKRFFYAHGGLVAFESTRKHLVLAGEPLLQTQAREKYFMCALESFAKKQKKKVCGYYVGASWNWEDYKKVPLGTSTLISLPNYKLEASYAKETRRALRKGKESGYQIRQLSYEDLGSSSSFKNLYRTWKRKKLPFNLKFLLSSPQTPSSIKKTELHFCVEKDGKRFAFCSLLPYVHDGKKCMYTDHLICHPQKEKHALSFLISKLILELKKEGYSELNLGLNPFAQAETKKSFGKLFSLLYKTPIWYKPQGLHFFKNKFAGTEKTEYCFYKYDDNRWLSLWDMAKVTLLHSGAKNIR